MFSGKLLRIAQRWARRGGMVLAVTGSLSMSPAGVAEGPGMQPGTTGSAMAFSLMAAAPALTLTCSPCTIPAQQRTQVRFAMQVDARVAAVENFPQLKLSRMVPGKDPVELGVMSRENASGSTATYSLSVSFIEQPGSFSVAVYPQPTTRMAMLAENQRSVAVAGPVQITVQNSTQGSTSGGSGLGGFLSGLLGSVLSNVGKNQPPAGSGQQTPPGGAASAPRIVQAQGLSFNLPPGFLFHGEIADAGGPVSLRNFDQYLGGGVVPQGGAEIEVTSVPAGSTSMQALLRTETNASSSQATAVDTLPAQVASYTDAFAPGFSYDSEAAYVAQNGRIYKFFLTYRSGDAGFATYRQAFATVLNTTHFSAR